MNDSRLGRVCSGISAADIVSGGGQADRSGEYRLLGPAGASDTGLECQASLASVRMEGSAVSLVPSGPVMSLAAARGRTVWRQGGGLSAPVEVFEDLFDHGRIFDARDHLDRTAAVVTGLDIDLEHPLQTLRPGHRDVAGGRWFVGRLGITPAASGRRHLLTQSMVRREHAVMRCTALRG